MRQLPCFLAGAAGLPTDALLAVVNALLQKNYDAHWSWMGIPRELFTAERLFTFLYHSGYVQKVRACVPQMRCALF